MSEEVIEEKKEEKVNPFLTPVKIIEPEHKLPDYTFDMLPEEQKAILASSLYTLVDSTKVDSLKAIFGSDITKMDSRYIEYFDMRPYSVVNNQVFSYPSKDGRKVCDVVTYEQENGKNQKGVFRAMSYDEHNHKCKWEGSRYEELNCLADDYLATHRYETIVDSKIIDVDGVPVVLKMIGAKSKNGICALIFSVIFCIVLSSLETISHLFTTMIIALLSSRA